MLFYMNEWLNFFKANAGDMRHSEVGETVQAVTA